MLPVLAALPQPLALIDVGSSAGLCLYPDRYRSRVCCPTPSGGPGRPQPTRPSDPEDTNWRECLVWPEQTGRLQRLRGALDVARAEPAPRSRGRCGMSHATGSGPKPPASSPSCSAACLNRSPPTAPAGRMPHPSPPDPQPVHRD
ncbi:DUF2332 family protein [Streptomyces sp. NPDC020883]|uniref:DUF2332 family protein n=1 Tax=Streptomyces sp. NPDC020883 TaxID=3365099 RepID=UPI00379D147D